MCTGILWDAVCYLIPPRNGVNKKPNGLELTPRGVLAVYMTGRFDVFFGVENLHPRYFLSQEICHVFFRFLKSVWLNKSVLRYKILYFFLVEILMLGIFLGVEFLARVFFWVRNMKLRGTCTSCILQVHPPPPHGNWDGWFSDSDLGWGYSFSCMVQGCGSGGCISGSYIVGVIRFFLQNFS